MSESTTYEEVERWRCLPVERYLEEFHAVLTPSTAARLRREIELNAKCHYDGTVLYEMLEFPEWANPPGGAYPGHFVTVRVTDHRKAQRWHEGALIPRPLRSSDENLEDARWRAERNVFNLPGRLTEKYRSRLVVMVGSQEAQDHLMGPDDLGEALDEMTPAERAVWRQKQFQLDVSLDASTELPIRIRLAGIDDGAEELLVEDMAEAWRVLRELKTFNDMDRRRHHLGFRDTD